jgi:citrate synthase
MKKINSVFFGEKGITSSSANHVCNIGKEYIEATHKSLDSLNFVTSAVSEFNGEKTHTLKEGVKISEEDILSKLSKIAEINSLIAYLREAIKAKSNELTLLKEKTFTCSISEEDYYSKAIEAKQEEFGFLKDEYTKYEIEDALAELNIKERNEYFSLEAEAAVIGKFIHPKSPYDLARTALMDCTTNSAEIKEYGNTVVVIKKTPTITIEEADNLFFKLQRKHREVSAQLNAIKHTLQERATEMNLLSNQVHETILSDYKELKDKEESKFNAEKIKETKEIANLKIVIPNSLDSTLNFLNTL